MLYGVINRDNFLVNIIRWMLQYPIQSIRAMSVAGTWCEPVFDLLVTSPSPSLQEEKRFQSIDAD